MSGPLPCRLHPADDRVVLAMMRLGQIPTFGLF